MIGQTVSHYRILEKLGEGGMGVVYKAKDARLNRNVALKFLPAELTRDRVAKVRFIHEAQAASSLQHNNIGVVHDIDETSDGQLFIVMEYYEGETLKDRIERGKLPLEEVVDITSQIAAGLAKAHQHNIIHRDIKPANILITPDGVAKIVDFGLAKLSGNSLLTRRGRTVGTVAYMSPEQSRSSDVDRRTDIWSLGIVLYEMLAGRKPFESDYEQALVYSILNEEPPPLTSFRHDVPGHLAALCARCLAKERESRPRSAEEVIRFLDVDRDRFGHRFRNLVGANRKWTRGAIVVSALVVIAAAWLWITLPTATPPAQPEKRVCGILLPENQTGVAATSALPTFVQWRLFDNFAGRNDIAVFDPVTVNTIIDSAMTTPGSTRDGALRELLGSTQISLVIDGTLRRTAGGYRIDLRAVEPGRAASYSASAEFPEGDVAANAVDTLSRQLAAGLRLEDEPRQAKTGAEQWHAPKVHPLPAVEAFASGAKFTSRGDSLSSAYLASAIQIDWAYIAPRALLATKLVARGSLDEARDHLRVLETLRKVASPYELALIDWADAVVQGNTGAEMRAVESLLEYSPGNGILLYVLARLQYMQMDFHACVETLQPVLKTRWHYSPMYYLLAESYEQLGRLAEARRLLEQSLPYEPVYPEIYSLLSAMCCRDGDSSLAVRYEEVYLEVTRKRGIPAGNAYGTLARLCLERGQDSNAERLFARAVREQPDSPPLHQGWGDALLFLGDTVAALRQYRRALELDARSPQALYRLGEILERQGDRKGSLRYTGLYLHVDSAGSHAAEARARLKRQKQ